MNTAVELNNFFSECDMIFEYTRAQAIADGVLIDLTSCFPSDTRMFKWSLACTSTVWNLIESAAAAEDLETPDVYVWDLAYMAFNAIKALGNTGSDRLLFKITLPLCENGTEHRLKLVCGPDDEGEPCLTIMRIDED